MLFTVHDLTADERAVFERIEDMRYQLRHLVREPRRCWTGLPACVTRATAKMRSDSVERLNATEEDALAAGDGEDPAEVDRETQRAVRGYRQAMDFILQRCRDRDFRFSRDMLLTVHFMLTQNNPQANPGHLRPGWVGVRNSETGKIVHEGVNRDQLESVLSEFIESLNGASQLPVMVRAAMAHLNLVMAHPFSDGNGRTARCIQTALLAKEGIFAADFSSIEDYVGRNHTAYYTVLSEVGGGTWAPQRDAHPWVRFCLTAHYRQAKALLRRSGIISIMDLIHGRLLTDKRSNDLEGCRLQ
jgi:Fic family protein